MTAKTIVGAPNLLFLGAGASAPYGKMLMGQFVGSFREKVANTNGGSLVNAICNANEDLEFLIEQLEELGSKEYIESETYERIPLAIGGSKEPRWPEFSQLAIQARASLAALKREVYVHYRSIQNRAATDALLAPLAELKTDGYPHVLFTTNYDPAVEEFCYRQSLRLNDGFVLADNAQEFIWERAAFDVHRPDSLVLFKLHGSANWKKDNRGRIVKSPPISDVNDPDYRDVMIYPATRKVATVDPFFTAYDYLERCLDEADSCLVIGYSFRDYDTIMRFKSAALSNKRLKIAVLDPRANDICAMLKKQHNILAHPIPHLFDEGEQTRYLPLIQAARSAAAAGLSP